MSAAGEPQICGRITQARAAKMMNVSLRSVQLASVVGCYGIAQLDAAIWAGTLRVSTAAWIARRPEAEQLRLIKLPSPAEARRQARETGRPVEAHNGKIYDGRMREQARADKAVGLIFAAVEILATTPISQADGLSRLSDHNRRKFAAALPVAVEFLNQLMRRTENEH